MLLHGGGPGCSSRLDFGPCLPHLPADRRHLLVDLAQYGDSAAAPFDDPALDFHVACLVGLLDDLALDQVDVVAQSLGGSVALNLAALHPARVGRIVLTGSQPVPSPSNDPGVAGEARARYYGGSGPSPAKMRELLASLEWYDAAGVPEATVQARFANSVTPWAMAVADGSGRGRAQDIGDRLPGIQHPTLWLWGAHDPFSSPAYAAAVAATMPRADIAVLANTAHHPQEERPYAYGRLVTEFLERKEER
ncbi:alpha/beta hydrolase [Streptomyces radicis]|uniref:Alpha/beta hydrolase n=2 Tax=Streptomyces radicis TaxID=1750517 RepID=A0A3A9WJD7_9ACTN|nr:alpha/beta hydrolase [Streptomyces radicis]RKN27836.1 alpha/beta hydrolase [Streptomyces radicis]